MLANTQGINSISGGVGLKSPKNFPSLFKMYVKVENSLKVPILCSTEQSNVSSMSELSNQFKENPSFKRKGRVDCA